MRSVSSGPFDVLRLVTVHSTAPSSVTPSRSVHGGDIQFSGLYEPPSECTSTDPSALIITTRAARPSDLLLLAAVEDAGGPLFWEHFGAGTAPVLLSPAPSGLDRDLR